MIMPRNIWDFIRVNTSARRSNCVCVSGAKTVPAARMRAELEARVGGALSEMEDLCG